MEEDEFWPWVRFPKGYWGQAPGVAFDMRRVERVEQLRKGCRVWFQSGGSVKVNASWTYIADMLRAWDPLNQGDEDDVEEEGKPSAQGT